MSLTTIPEREPRLDRLFFNLSRPGVVFVVLFVLTAFVMGALDVIGGPLKIADKTPFGILHMEFPWTAATANWVLEAWSEQPARDALLEQTQLDFLLLLLYPVTLSLGCWLLARKILGGPLEGFGRTASSLVLAAAPLDAVENVLILTMRDGQFANWIPFATSAAATLKFQMVGIALVFLVLGSWSWLRSRKTPRGALNQVTMPSTDLEPTIGFYQRLGLTLIVDSRPRYARFECPDGGSTMSLHHVDSVPDDTGVTIYFEIADLDERVRKLRESGLDVDDPVDQRWLWRETRIKDPDGNVVCLYKAGRNRRFPPWRVDPSS